MLPVNYESASEFKLYLYPLSTFKATYHWAHNIGQINRDGARLGDLRWVKIKG